MTKRTLWLPLAVALPAGILAVISLAATWHHLEDNLGSSSGSSLATNARPMIQQGESRVDAQKNVPNTEGESVMPTVDNIRLSAGMRNPVNLTNSQPHYHPNQMDQDVVATPIPKIPALFGDPMTILSKATPNQIEQLSNIAARFTEEVQASGVDPNSPDYIQAWNSAASRANLQIQQQFGDQGFDILSRSIPNP